MNAARLALLSVAIVSAQTPPKLLSDALKHIPGVRILDPKIDLATTQFDELRRFITDDVSSWVEADFDHDGILDAAAAVTRSPSEGTEFGVIAVHAKTPQLVHWIAPFQNTPLFGVDFPSYGDLDSKARFIWRDRIMPLSCLACDSNSWARWTGQVYAAELYDGSDRLAILDQTIYSEPTKAALRKVKSRPCQVVRVLDFRNVDWSARWYLVQSGDGKSILGWVPAASVNAMSPFSPRAEPCSAGSIGK